MTNTRTLRRMAQVAFCSGACGVLVAMLQTRRP